MSNLYCPYIALAENNILQSISHQWIS